jgi:hypothetical protein
MYSPVPVPVTRSQKIVQQREALDLWEEPEKGARRLAEPDATRRPSARAARGDAFTERDFRRLCAVLREAQERDPQMTPDALVAHVEGLALRANLPCPPEASERLAAVLVEERLRQRDQARVRRATAWTASWRDRCAHTPKCTTPTQCALRAAKEGR